MSTANTSMTLGQAVKRSIFGFRRAKEELARDYQISKEAIQIATARDLSHGPQILEGESFKDAMARLGLTDADIERKMKAAYVKAAVFYLSAIAAAVMGLSNLVAGDGINGFLSAVYAFCLALACGSLGVSAAWRHAQLKRREWIDGREFLRTPAAWIPG